MKSLDLKSCFIFMIQIRNEKKIIQLLNLKNEHQKKMKNAENKHKQMVWEVPPPALRQLEPVLGPPQESETSQE